MERRKRVGWASSLSALLLFNREGQLCEIHTGVKMSLKSPKATKKMKTRKHGFETEEFQATKKLGNKRGQSQFSTLVVYTFIKKLKLKHELKSLITLHFYFTIFNSGV